MPVSTSSDDSQFKMLLGKRVCIDLTDDEDRAELTCLLLALGLNPVHSTQIQPAQPCDLYFFDNPEKIQYFSNTLAVEVTATPILSGWRDSGSGYPSLSSNPFMWGSVVYVCRELLGVGTKNTSSRSRTETSHRPLILVAEDHPTNQALIKSQLDRLGFDCEIAANGSEALHQFNENVHCMVITDCYMPVMDGYSLAEKLRGKLQDRKNFPILAMTASILVEEKQRCASVGIDECLLKPLSLDTLRQALKRWLPDSKTFLTEPRNEKEKKSADWQALLSLLDESPEFKELIKGFIHTTEADIAYIESLSMPKEQKTLLEQLHRLRGGLQMFRLMELAGRSELIERELAGGGDAMSFELVNFLSDVRIILKYLKELVSERS
ncbi:response regulator [Pseudomonas poae]|uniref:response regulator n=1 Tax=Pseudomonas poae TaxID=200451 RepID=UPI0030D337B8